MDHGSGEVWGIIRGTLRERFSFSQIKDIVGRGGLPVERLSHLTQGLSGASKGQLMDAVDRLFGQEAETNRDRFVRSCITEMSDRSPEARQDLEILLSRLGWIQVGGVMCPPGRRQSEIGNTGAADSSPDIDSAFPDENSPIKFHRQDTMKPSTSTASTPNGDRVFIGHGHSHMWLILQQFLTQELGLKCDEFNREPVAGIHNVDRLQQMLDEACFAFIVMTADDERADGSKHARANVIHEAGLFQGRLGFKKAIILLEEGCADFSNIDGLTHIPFPKGKIMACSEDIRRTLRREKVLKA